MRAVYAEAARSTEHVWSRGTYGPAQTLGGTVPVRTRECGLIACGGAGPFIGVFIVRSRWVCEGLAFVKNVETIKTAAMGVHNHLV